jgi:type II secretory pathway component GspD/PulD (secretin)
VRWVFVRACVAAAGCAAAGIGVSAQTPQRPGPPAPLPLTQYDEHPSSADLDARTFSLAFPQPVPVREALVAFVRGTDLSIVTDPAAAGTFIGDLKNVTVRQALEVVLPPLGLAYDVDGSLIRVFRPEPETRIFDLNYVATERTGTVTVGTADGAAISSTTKSDVFGEVAAGVRALLSEHATVSVDRRAGLLQATDVPERLDRIAVYLEAVQDRVQRQAQIDVRIFEVELNDEKATGIDWSAIAAQMDQGGGNRTAARSRSQAFGGMRVVDVTRLLTLLEAQGKVAPIASPRLLTLNNEPALVRTESVTFSVTPQISGDAHFTLSLSPVVARPTVAEADMLARVADGETLVLSGLGRDRETRERRAAGISGGWFGRATVVTRHRIELVILLTPRLVRGASAE